MQSVWYHNSFVDEPTWSSTNVEFSERSVVAPVTPRRKRPIDGSNHCNSIKYRIQGGIVPEEEEDLPVHPKKIAELKKWLTSRMGVRVGFKTLLLTGPCGSGKTTAVKVLCAELGIEVLEFDGNQEYQVSYNGEDIYEKPMLQTFYQFMSNAECSSLEKMSLKQRLLLIKQLPNVFIGANFQDHEILRKALRSFASFSRCMIVFVLTSSETSWELNPSRLFSSATMDEFQIQQNIVCLLGVKMDKTEDIKRIVSLANGDLRKTLNMIEFFAIGRPLSLNLLASADAHFDLFHFIGKIMYAKRATNSTDSWMKSEEKLLPKARRKIRMFPPKEDLNELADSNFISGKFLTSYIFEHEPSFAPTIRALKSVESNLCFSIRVSLGIWKPILFLTNTCLRLLQGLQYITTTKTRPQVQLAGRDYISLESLSSSL
uniref:Cell cycle checkpoint protein RAD17 n=1 Tax=Ditylenchus dipsaci TaxID=166011 RepID=A0A915ERY3_9BILA